MSKTKHQRGAVDATRRLFLKSSALFTAGAALSVFPAARLFAAGSDKLKVGVIGCGGRGTGAAVDMLEAAPDAVEIWSLGDAFKDRLDGCRGHLKEEKDVVVADDRCFVGLDSFEKVIASGVDAVILATAPGFRPQHIEAAAKAKKHIFAEKPVATDPAGVRKVLEAARIIDENGTSFVTGTQRRHQRNYLECMSRIEDGAIGEFLGGSCYWHQGGLWVHRRKPEYSDLEWQCRNWLYFVWTSGDHIVEQHVHNIDVMNWAAGGPPAKAFGMGGRAVRTAPEYGNVFDHFYVEFEYKNGARVHSSARQIDGCESRVEEFIQGAKGRAHTSPSFAVIEGEKAWKFEGKNPNPYVLEHVDFIAAIRSGKRVNEAKRIAESTLTAIMGRMSAYTGKVVTWEQALDSKLDLFPKKLAFGPNPIDAPAVPGRTPLE